ncbi:MAG TPA: filamentous hemagglutinin N-terminal domain-containing protein, partial [Brevundimonas sp.]|nr:filamentous hemagglutinin N-terminal domain-containing protein [Brevundimonas sp.]
MTRLQLIAGDRTPAARRASLSASTCLAGVAAWVAVSLGSAVQAQTLPTGGSVTAGGANIVSGPGAMTINQSSQNVAINWNSFSIGQGGTVVFVQPNSTSVALNRVLGPDASAIFGSLTSNGQVFLINPNGVLFGQGSQVNVGGLVASTLGMSDADFMAGDYRFSGAGGGSVLNQGAIIANGGYVALLGGRVSNEGLIQANLGAVVLAAGEAMTLDVAGDGLLSVVIDKGAANALVQNGGMLQADGGRVIMTAQGAGDLLRTAVNNTGVVQARTIGERNGTILLLGDMQSDTLNVSGVLDASAPDGGDGGFIETSAGTVNIAAGARITSDAPKGKTGTWLIDPADFTIGAGGNISGATLSAQLVTTNVVISTMTGPGASLPGNGDIHVNDAIAWTASSTPTTLTLNANRDVNINAAITATNGNLVVCCGRDVNVNAPITTVNGSVLLNAGQNVNVYHAITTTDGNIALCAGHDVHIDAAITLTRGSTIPAQSLGLPVGLTLIAGADGSGPGVGGGTIIFSPLAPKVTVTKAPVTINYNPVSYAAPSDFSTRFTLTEGAALKQRMLLFPDGGRAFDGTTATTLNGFRTTAVSGLPTGVSLVAGPNASATFDSAAAGADVGITYSGYSLAGANADQYALAGFCCVSTFRTRGTISS